jgi:lipopolysaccharide/colanic/teichoic acid biosynthesis glycosyltransferase
MFKRLFDILGSVCGLVLLTPLFALIALAIKLDSRGPVFFRQKRVGLGGEPFQIFKFRSMVVDAPKLGPFYTSTNDPRITPVGRILRKTSLDELPQILNVLLGEMSIVGPRPNVFEQRDQYTEEEWNLRNSVLPGITGLAQATRRSAATTEERNSLDLDYVRRSSLRLDLQLILMTVRQVVFTGGN